MWGDYFRKTRINDLTAMTEEPFLPLFLRWWGGGMAGEVWKAAGSTESRRGSRKTKRQWSWSDLPSWGGSAHAFHTEMALFPVHTLRVFVDHSQQSCSAVRAALLSCLSSLLGNKWERKRCVTFQRWGWKGTNTSWPMNLEILTNGLFQENYQGTGVLVIPCPFVTTWFLVFSRGPCAVNAMFVKLVEIMMKTSKIIASPQWAVMSPRVLSS